MLPLPGSAAQLDFATQQAGQLAADRQTQPRSAVLAAGAGICLLEGLEDDALLVRWNANAGVRDFKSNHRCRFSENRVILRSTRSSPRTLRDARHPVP